MSGAQKVAIAQRSTPGEDSVVSTKQVLLDRLSHKARSGDELDAAGLSEAADWLASFLGDDFEKLAVGGTATVAGDRLQVLDATRCPVAEVVGTVPAPVKKALRILSRCQFGDCDNEGTVANDKGRWYCKEHVVAGKVVG